MYNINMNMEIPNNQPPKPEDIVVDFINILDKLLQSNNLTMRDLVVLKRMISHRQIPTTDDLEKFSDLGADIKNLKQKTEDLGTDNIPWADLKQAIENTKLKY